MQKILIVEDEKNINQLIRDTLSLKDEFKISSAFDGEDGLKQIKENKFDLILLDIMLPKLSGFDLLENINTEETPVIFLTAKSDIESKIRGLTNGAIDYITKPFEPLELLARVELRLKKEKITMYKNIEINEDERIVYKDGVNAELAPKEYDLFALLLRNVGKVISREKIFRDVWNINVGLETRTIDYHIQQLRKKLDLKDEIVTVNRVGYRLEKVQ